MTVFRKQQAHLRLILWMIRTVGVIVPRRLRADWKVEWEAELCRRELMLAEWDRLDWRGKLDLLRRSVGAFRDALVLQPKRLEEEMFQDLSFGARMLFKQPGFMLIAILTLALGIGANTAIFSVVNAVLLRPLPYDNPGQLVGLWGDMSGRRADQNQFSPAEITDFRDQLTTFEEVGLYDRGLSANLTGGAQPERVNGAEASPGLFTTLRVNPVLGRTFLPEETDVAQSKVAMISEGLWRRRFGSDPNFAGRVIQLDGVSYTVVGVLPAGFKFPEQVDLWLPFAFTAADWKTDRSHYYVEAVGRLKPGVTLAQARADLETIVARLAPSFPAYRKKWGITLIPLQEQVVGKISSTLWILFGAVGFVLLIACVNVANLLLTRASLRATEMTIRAALGASRMRIVRQMLTESLLLAALGGGAGALLAFGAVKLFSVSSLNTLPRAEEVAVDGWALTFTLLVSLLTGAVFGLTPALQASKPNLNETLKEGGRGSSGARSGLRNALVVTEIALSLILLVGAGLLIKSLVRLQGVGAGFDPHNLLTMQVTMPRGQYPNTESQYGFVRENLRRIEALPGVKSAAATINPPLIGTWGMRYVVADHDNAPMQIADNANITPKYFQTMGIPILQGRDFSDRDAAQGPPVVIIGETLARKHFADENPIGQRINAGGNREIVGVVGDVKPRGLELETKPQIYIPYAQKPTIAAFFTFTIRTTQDPLGLANTVVQTIQSLDKDMPVANIRAMDQIISNSLAQRRLTTLLLGGFAAIAAALAAIGIYGVVSYSVAQRAHELGIRMALGARGKDVLTLTLAQGLKLAALGVALGLVGSFWLTGILKEMLFGVRATDPLTFVAVASMLLAVAMAACFIPARRATKVDPVTALRHQ
jgi:putative ABC transport system permease protein